MRWTGGRKTQALNRRDAELRQHMASIKCLSGRPIEVDAMDLGMALKELPEVICRQALVTDIRIQGPHSNARAKDVPHCDASGHESAETAGIGGRRIELKDFAHDPPEGVSGVRIVLAQRERVWTRHRAKNQDLGIAVCHRCKTVNQSHVDRFASARASTSRAGKVLSRWSLHTWRQRRAPGRPWRRPSMWRAMLYQGVPSAAASRSM